MWLEAQRVWEWDISECQTSRQATKHHGSAAESLFESLWWENNKALHTHTQKKNNNKKAGRSSFSETCHAKFKHGNFLMSTIIVSV